MARRVMSTYWRLTMTGGCGSSQQIDERAWSLPVDVWKRCKDLTSKGSSHDICCIRLEEVNSGLSPDFLHQEESVSV